jgi:hypothetical protein
MGEIAGEASEGVVVAYMVVASGNALGYLNDMPFYPTHPA